MTLLLLTASEAETLSLFSDALLVVVVCVSIEVVPEVGTKLLFLLMDFVSAASETNEALLALFSMSELTASLFVACGLHVE